MLPISAPLTKYGEEVPPTVQKHAENAHGARNEVEECGHLNAQRKGEDLDGRYGKIGISAVAAALPYQSDAKNPAYAPVVPRDDESAFGDGGGLIPVCEPQHRDLCAARPAEQPGGSVRCCAAWPTSNVLQDSQ